MPSSEREYQPSYYTLDGSGSDNYHSCKYVQLSTGDTLEGLLQNAPTMHYAIDDAAGVCAAQCVLRPTPSGMVRPELHHVRLSQHAAVMVMAMGEREARGAMA